MTKFLVLNFHAKHQIFNGLNTWLPGAANKLSKNNRSIDYTRRTKILKRLVRKVIHKVEVPLDYFTSVEAAKAEARRQMDAYVKEYYRNH